MLKQSSDNSFNDGLVMDLNPLLTPNNVMTGCLNGTLITYNGNEYTLQNDMGNGRVETAMLPEGYIPVGTTELGGIIYIVSYNPIKDKCQIGSFPSPERNITLDELGYENGVTFQEGDFKNNNYIISPVVRKQLGNITLNPGDKFLVCGDTLTANISTISHYKNDTFIRNYVNFRLATIDNNGRIIYLDNLRKYLISKTETNKYELHIKQGDAESNENTNLDEYRKIVGSEYQIFTSKVAGNLYVIGQLEVIDYIESINWELISVTDNPPEDTKNNIIEFSNSTDEVDPEVKVKYYTIKYTVKTYSEYDNKAAGFIIKGLNSNSTSLTFTNPSNPEGTTEEIRNQRTDTLTFNICYKALNNSSADIEIIPYMEFGILDYLKQMIHIDFSLLGSDQITNDIWEYWKDENSMHIKFDINNNRINENIQRVQLTFKNLEDNTLEEFVYDLPIKKSYNGRNYVIIPFNDRFIANSLYKVIVKFQFENEAEFDEWVCVHYLYTNGVFNDLFVNSEDENFDNQYLTLVPTTKLDNISQMIPLFSENKLISNSFTSKIPMTFIQGQTIYSAIGQTELNIQVGLKNDYNTFSFTELVPSIEMTGNEAPKITTTVYNEYNIDSDYIGQFKDVNTEKEEKCDVSIIKQNNKTYLNYDIKLISPITADSVQKEVSVTDYYAPVLSSLEDFSKYGMTVNIDYEETETKDLQIQLDTFAPAMGMSGGGHDNEGAGGLMFVCGQGSVGENSTAATSGTYPLTLNCLADSNFATGEKQGRGKAGIYKFPNNYINNIIQELKPDSTVVPVLLRPTGTFRFVYKKGKYLIAEADNKFGKEDDARVKWFEESTPVFKYCTFLLFVKSKDSEDYLPIPYFLVMDKINQVRKLDRYYQLLAQLYAKRPFTDLVKIYTVYNIGYLDKVVSFDRTINASVTYNSSNLLFNGKSLSKLFTDDNNKQTDKKLKLKNTPNCFQLESNEKLDIQEVVTFKFDIANKYYDTYLDYKNSATVQTFVRSELATDVPTKKSNSGLYIIQIGEKSQLVPVTNKDELRIYNLSLDESGYLIAEDTANSLGAITNLSMFQYDERSDALCVNRSKMTSFAQIVWGCNENNSKDFMQLCNNSIDREHFITSLPQEK